ncbi:PspA/IM30 family protein [Nocardia sp. NPDC058058]|uniref:PspA/IM30 family protein n=1 Tax=Nocardia sp. NPDC058058 TaxID=3346317 RepID=UPI0036D9EDFA
MSDARDLGSELAGLPDAELAAAVEQATEGRAALAALHAVAASVAATVGHAPAVIDVTPDTEAESELPPVALPDTFGQVEGGPVVTGVPVPPAGIPVAPGIGGYTNTGVPTFESVRDKVEQRYGTAQGMGELDRQTPVGRSVEEQWDAREKAARERLEQIRKSVHGNDSD